MILQQFTKVVIVFFTINGVLQAFPQIGINHPLAIFIPLSFIIVLGIIKEAVVEVRRWREDRDFNSTTCPVLDWDSDKKEFAHVTKRLDEIHVGDILELADDA